MRKHPASMTPAERDAARFHPAGWAAIRCKDGESVVYYGTNRDGKPAATAYRGKAIKCEWSYYFGSEQKRAARVQEFIASVAANVADKAKRQAERKAFQHTLQVGDVLESSWGYDQTNIDYYQVTKRSDKCVWIRPIKARSDGSGWTGDCVPMPGEFEGEETRHAVTQQNSVRVRSFAYAHKIEPRIVGGVKFYPVSHWTAYA